VRDSDLDIGPELVARLVRSQHPEYASEVTLVAHGWDSDIFRLGERFAARLPRRVESAALVVNEQRWLAELAPRLPVPVPRAVAHGTPGLGFPWPWSIMPWLDGHPADLFDATRRDACAEDLASALLALHVPAPVDAPRNAYRGVPLLDHDARVRSQLRSVGLGAARPESIWDDALAASSPEFTRWIHGDLHPANVLLTDDGRLAAILDFGDLCVGDPAVDLASSWLFFTGVGRARFRRTVDEASVDDVDLWRRARGWALAISLGLMTESDGTERMTSLGRHGLVALLSER
jgi:aminoglycoside phosphotransferase (APT) family kinase protein